MNEIEHSRPTRSRRQPPAGMLAFPLVCLVFVVGCGDASVPPPPPLIGGTGGSGGSGGTGGMSGTGGIAGVGGMSGTGGMAGTGGVVGTGGTGGTGGSGGTGGTGGALGACVTKGACHTCPNEVLNEDLLCNTNADCTERGLFGHLCIASGCETHAGNPIKQCLPAWAGSCIDDGDCPNPDDYDCTTVGFGGTPRCVRTVAGCNPSTESYDCAPGFSCEGGTCVDRRVPCGSTLDCPKSHICLTSQVSSYCVRAHRTCHAKEDCSWGGVSVGEFCEDVDNDERKECTGELSTGNACVNSLCPDFSVCETGDSGRVATCGDYGLCRTNEDCATGFSCVGLWQDDRRECVRTGGLCDQVTDCDANEVCASARNGGSPACQAGAVN